MINSHFLVGETSDPGASQLTRFAYLPSPLRYLYYLYVKYIKRDVIWASLLREFGPKSAFENWKLVARREAFRATWHSWWSSTEQMYDFILCPVNATPALPHKAMRDAVSSCGYTFLWNLLDYSAGVIPTGHVDVVKDALVPSNSNVARKNAYRAILKENHADNGVAHGAWKHYDAEAMHGLPTAVQVVGRRWEEEKVLGFMEVVEQALEGYKESNGEGGKYKLLEID